MKTPSQLPTEVLNDVLRRIAIDRQILGDPNARPECKKDPQFLDDLERDIKRVLADREGTRH